MVMNDSISKIIEKHWSIPIQYPQKYIGEEVESSSVSPVNSASHWALPMSFIFPGASCFVLWHCLFIWFTVCPMMKEIYP